MTGWQVTHMGTVYPWEADHMGHMNVRFYIGRFDEATWRLLASVGLTPSYLRGNQCGMVAVDQQTSYRQELLPGDIVTVRSRLLAVGGKSLRFTHEMTNGESGEIAATTELVGVHIDRQSRKSVALPPEVRDKAQRLLDAATPDPAATDAIS